MLSFLFALHPPSFRDVVGSKWKTFHRGESKNVGPQPQQAGLSLEERDGEMKGEGSHGGHFG